MVDCIVSAVRGRKYEAVQDTLRANKEAYCRACGYRCLRLPLRPPPAPRQELTSAFRHRPHLISEYFGQNIAGCEELY